MIISLITSVLPAQAAPRPPEAASAFEPIVRQSNRHNTSRPLAAIAADRASSAPDSASKGDIGEIPTRVLPKALDNAGAGRGDGSGGSGVAPNAPVTGNMPAFDNDFEGVGNVDGVLPPDTDGDVGPDHYMQWVNLSFAIWDKDGNQLVGPTPGNALFEGLGGPCENTNNGDPIVLYDQLADRWMGSQFALPNFPSGPFYECIAVSATGDPTGAWHQYEFLVSETKMDDYPKFGVWPDAYYMAVNQFNENALDWGGQGVAAFERDAMLNGDPADMVYFDLFGVNPDFGGQMPSDLEGFAPPEGTPNYFMEADDESFGVFDTDRLSIWEFHVDWADPLSSTFGLDGEPNLVLDTEPFEMELCGFNRSCIPQPDTSQGLDAISDRLMFRLQYRDFGDHASLVTNHTVDATGEDQAGVRWYELRDTGSGWSIHQQGTYAPDSDHRWMGSAAMDAAGNIAIGYSVSSETTFPSIRVTGRLAGDPLGELPQGESEMIAGTGSQTHPAARWGDYSAMTIDPVDQCTFWYTQEYLSETSSADWQTRIGHFKFPSCSLGPTGTITGTVTDAATALPIEGATVTAGEASTTTEADGTYTFVLPVGTYDMTASAYGYATATASGVVVTEGATVTQDFALTPLPTVTVDGTVTDGSGHGWPLYARIDIDGYPGGPVFTDPVTGGYSVELVQETDFTLRVNAVSPGYLEETREVNYSTAAATEDFALEIDQVACIAPGYELQPDGIFEPFDGEEAPPGWTVVDHNDSGFTWRFDDPGDRGNLTGGTGNFAIADSDIAGFVDMDTSLVSPVVDLSGVSDPVIRFNTDYFHYDPSHDVADVDLSLDGGATWDNVWRQEEDLRGPALVEVAIPQAADDADVQVRFHYYRAFFAFWWQVDNVIIGVAECVVVPGGLLVGNVYDEVTGEALNDATVTSDDNPEDTTTTGPTPDDPALDDGFYILFSSLVGAHDFTASKANYASDTETVTVVEDDVVRQDFNLGSGHLVVDPTSLEVTVPMGGTAEETLVITNDGTADASFEIGERDHGFDILSQHGARLTHRSGTFTPYAFNAAARRSVETERPIPPPRAAPWTDVADYPTDIMDSTADAFDGKVYSVGGFDGGGNTNAGFVYDPASDSWSEIASMSEIREKPAAAFVDGLLYVVGGWDEGGTPSDVLEIYDPSSDSWTMGASVPTAYAAAVAVVNDGLLYVIGGCMDTCGATDVFVYDPTGDSWSSVAPYPEDVSWTHCASIDGLIYCAGGVSDSSGELDATYVYDPAADSWTQLASMPQTQWAGGYVGAGGLLLVSGGVTDNFATVTNEGFAYDPGSDSWSSIPNSNNVVYRGASACGFYKVGGSIGGFSPIPATELLPDITDCAAVADVTWLSEDPTSGTVPPGGSVEVTVTFDAGVPEVTQPGAYLADLTFTEDTPYSVPPVPVTMNVTPPANWGKLDGTIVGLSRCDAPGSPLANASVHINGVNSDFDITTDENGYYEWWMPANNDPLILTVSKEGWVSKSRSAVAINPGAVTTVNFTLRLDAPCAETSPDSLDITVLKNDTATVDLLLQNVGGARGYSFTIDESEFALDPLAPAAADGGHSFSAAAGSIGPASARSLAPGQAPGAPVPARPPWFGATDIPGGLVRFAHTQCDGDENTFYVAGGVDGTFSVSDKLWRFDAAETEWTELAPMPEGGEGPTATCDAGRIHVMGGDGTDRHFVYDIGSDSWTTAAPLPRPVWGAAAASWNGTIYLIGGDADFAPGETSNEVNIYDSASDTWVGTGTEMPFAAVTPGFYQAAQYLYVVGGWDDGSPDANLAASQRYDLTSDTWDTGPMLAEPRADLALAATDRALFAIGGEGDGGGFFDGTRTTERLDLANWDAGNWTTIDQLPLPLTANNGGFCSTATLGPGTEVWSAGGLDSSSGSIQGRMFFRQAARQACATIRSDVPWLSTAPDQGGMAHDATKTVKVTVDASDLAVGEHDATLLISTTDPAHAEMRVPVHVTVESRPIVAYLSVIAGTTLEGLAVRDEDVVIVHDDGSVETYFDGSDLGMNDLAIDAFAHSNNGSLVMSFTQPGGVPGIIGTVDDSDLVRFIPTSLGTVTAGTFVRWFDGSDVGLTLDDEDVDGVDVRPNGSIIISTAGTASVPGVPTADDSDLLRFIPTQLGTHTAGSWVFRLDGSDVGLSTDSEDIDAVAIGTAVHLSTVGPLAVPGLIAADEDVATFHQTRLGLITEGEWDAVLLVDGSTIGLAGNDVTAVELP